MSPRDTIVVAPVLRPDVRQYSQAVAESGRLRGFFSGANFHERSALAGAIRLYDRVLGGRFFSRTEARRIQEEIPAERCSERLWPEILARIGERFGLTRFDSRRLDWVFAQIDREAARNIDSRTRLVIAQEDACLSSFREAANVGAKRVYDLPIPHHSVLSRALAEESAEFPGISTEAGVGVTFHPERTERKDAELAAADHLMVASDYVREGALAAGIPAERIAKIPYGCEAGKAFRPFVERKPMVLCVGHLSIRKGVPRLLRVWKKLGAQRTHTLRLIGKNLLTEAFLADYSGHYEYLPPQPHSALWQHFSEAQLFAFPSACDGFGLVMNESLSCGTPILASSRTGAPGYLNEGSEGLTYPHGDDDALAAHLDSLLSEPSRLRAMGENAHRFAQNWSWAHYRAAVRAFFATIVPFE